ncbi:MAG TPA: hypothetical protein EYQ69_03400 [Gemmatimonadetes bacterium]|jgi:hypothetical protein|nr:hypothetical protein [Gemmatimonadota bacterium]
MEDRRSIWLLITLALVLGLLAFVSTPTILFIEGARAAGFEYWCSSNQWIQMFPDVPQLELGTARHPGCQRNTSVALVRFFLVSLTAFSFGKVFLKRVAG